MSQTQRICKNNTKVVRNGNDIRVTLHSTDVVTIVNGRVTLNSGGWWTSTTKTRINQTANELGLNFGVYQKAGHWFVTVGGTVLNYFDGITFEAVR